MKKFTFLALACIFALVANAQVFVKPAADGGADSNDGRSWDNAKATVAAAIPVAFESTTVKEVWVKKGTYTESWGTAWSSKNIAGVSIFGGFNGDETAVSARAKGAKPWEYTNETIITFGLASGNAFVVTSLTADAPCLVDGFSFKNMTPTANGTIAYRDNTTLQNCILASNTMEGKMIDCYVTGTNGPARIMNCLFKDNESTKNNIVQLNPSVGSSLMDGCLFVGNKAEYRVVALGKKSYLINTVFYNNEAGKSAGDVVNMAESSEIVNCLFYNNTVAKNVILASGLVINSTIVNNKGGGIALAAATGKIYNTIVRGNVNATNEPVALYGDMAAEVKNSAFVGNLPAKVMAENNIQYFENGVVGFVTPSAFVGSDKEKATELAAANWQLTNKPHGLIGGGGNAFFDLVTGTVTKDLAGSARVQNDKIDLGAYESTYSAPVAPVLTIAPGVNGVTSVEKNGGYFMGEGVFITSTADDGYKLKEWKDGSGNQVSVIKDFTFVMPETSVTLTATFEKATKRTLTVVVGENGQASVDKAGSYYADEVIALTATPNEDYVFANWTNGEGAILSTQANFEFTMPDKDATVKANFKYKLTRYLISEKEGDKWTRTAERGETIIDLTTIGKPFDEFVAGNLWPTPLSEGDEVWLLGSVYEINQPLTFTQAGVKWFGGFAGTETSAADRVKIDNDENGIIEAWEFENPTVFYGMMQENEIVGTVLKMDQGITVDGVTIQGGRQGAVDNGAGVRVGENDALARPSVLRNSIVRENLVTGSGTSSAYTCGAVAEHNGTIEYCLIEENIIDGTNMGATYAAGVAAPRSTSLVANCVIRNNRNLGKSGVNNHGGGAKVGGGTLINCLIYNNVATRGAGLYIGESQTAIVQYCTIANNKSESYLATDELHTNASGGGVYFRGKAGANTGGTMENSVVWNNECQNASRNNIFIEGDARNPAVVALGVNAYNGGSDDLLAGTFLPGDGNENSISNLPNEGVFVKPTRSTGYIVDAIWNCDWRPATEKQLQVAVQLAKQEYDMLGYKRSATPTLGAYEFGSVTGINNPSLGQKLEALVYSADGKLYVSHSAPVAIEVYTASGVQVAMKQASVSHELPLPQGLYVVVVKDNKTRNTAKVMIR